ncbi:MAG: hypothetical protein CVU42_17170 [Chloroflexi bacterium HGW-Chloroflexi-4]|nr:MAG: hypothetical protein CVU42_17170 [Chloroflexi bacterium HGW-Chloroflexi-4]
MKKDSRTTQTNICENRISGLDLSDAWILLLLVSLFVVSRLLWLWLNPFSAGYFEDNYRWVAAHELLSKPALTFLDYQADHYQGGSLVMILLVCFYFLLFGESVISLKLAALTFSVGIIVMLYLIGRMFFGRTAGIIAALCYLTGPPLAAVWGLVVLGSHGESIFLSLLQIFLYLGILSGTWRSSSGLWLFGLVSGLGIWFCYTTGLSLLACALCFLVLKGLPKRNELLWIILGFLMGVSPWFIYNIQYDFAGIGRIMEIFGYGKPPDNWLPVSRLDKIISFFTTDFPSGAVMPYGFLMPGIMNRALIVIFYLLFGVSFILSVWRVAGLFRKSIIDRLEKADVFEICTRQREMVFVAYAIIFILVYGLSSFILSKDIEPSTYRLFIPLSVILLMPLAVSFVYVLKKNNKLLKGMVWIGLVLFLSTSATGTVALAARSPNDNQFVFQDNRGYVHMGYLLHIKYKNNLEKAFAIANQYAFMPEKKNAILRGIGWGLQNQYEMNGELNEFFKTVKEIPPNDQLYVLQGIDFFSRARLHTVSQYINGLDKHFTMIRDRLLAILKWVAQEKATFGQRDVAS